MATCKHLGIDPFAYLRDLLPALYALSESPHEEALAYWLPDVWQRRQADGPDGRSPDHPCGGSVTAVG